MALWQSGLMRLTVNQLRKLIVGSNPIGAILSMLKLKYPSKSLLSNLTSIYGISSHRGKELCMRVGVEP